MNDSSKEQRFTLRAFSNGKCVFRTAVDRRLIVGRQRTNEPPPFSRCDHADESRIVIAGRTDTLVSREHFLLEPQGDDAIRLVNLSQKRSISIEPGDVLQPSQERRIEEGTRVILEGISLRLDANRWEDREFSPLDAATMPPQPSLMGSAALGFSMTTDALMGTLGSSFDTLQGEVLLRWLKSIAEVFQSAASNPQFLDLAVRSVSQIVGLPQAVALVFDDGQWSVKATHGNRPSHVSELSSRMLEKLLDQKRTFVFHPSANAQAMASLANIEAVVAAPILDEFGDLVGALYATRPFAFNAAHEGPQITKLEASLVELIACGVAAGWARIKHEQAAIKARIQFEQFFGPDLAARLETDPELLVGRDTNITVMFCDIAGFSGISEKFGAEILLPWINESLGAMSECVIRHSGVLVDYVGDELMAMWGAPLELPDHANRAALAACEIIECIDRLSQKWSERLHQPFHVRIGINSGSARVGNVGSEWKFKYGAIGNTVNLAARIRGATKFANCQIMIAEATAKQLTSEFNLRRVGAIQVVNIDEPVNTLEILPHKQERWRELSESYHRALNAFEERDFKAARHLAQQSLLIAPEDSLTQLLLQRIEAATHAPNDDSTVWILNDK